MPITSDHGSLDVLGGVEYLNCEPNEPFVLMASPASGSVQTEGLDKPTWLPELGLFRLRPGIRFMRVASRNESLMDVYREAVKELEKDGEWTAIPMDLTIPGEFTADGIPLRSYMVTHDCRHLTSGATGKCYTEFYARRVQTRRSKDPVKWEFSSMRAKRNQWILQLIKDGVIPVPDEWCRRDRTADAENWAASQAVIEDPAKREDYATRAEQRAEMHREAVVPSAEPSEPKPKGRRAQKASA